MKENLTELVFILDRSGSMMGLEADTIGGYNSMIEKQKQEPGKAKVTTILFDDRYEVLHDAVDIQAVEPLANEYYARGGTALMDAVGRAINSVGARLANTPEEERPSQVIVVITTDGYENCSQEFTRGKVKKMIEHQTNKYSWKFMFLGANIDATAEAESMGISADWATNYTYTAQGTSAAYACVSAMASTLRSIGEVDCTLKACYDAAEADAVSAAEAYTELSAAVDGLQQI